MIGIPTAWKRRIMNARTEEFLMFLLFGADQLMRPTYRNLSCSFKSWAYGNGFGPQLKRLAHKKLIEAQENHLGPVYRLTEAGRLRALGGRNPRDEWARTWDGRWRLILFDLPETHRKARLSLRRSLKQNGFGWLQNSAWISPHPVADLTHVIKGRNAQADTLLFLECTCPPGYSGNAEIVSATWAFSVINERYRACIQFLKTYPPLKSADPRNARQMLQWWRQEHALWIAATTEDPLLPQCLHPRGYLGPEAWKRRIDLLHRAAKDARLLSLPPESA